MTNLDEIKARRGKITQGKWEIPPEEDEFLDGSVNCGDKNIALCNYFESTFENMNVTLEDQKNNADFIANAPTDIDWLTDVYETAVFELLRQADCVCRTNDGSFNSSAITHQADILHALKKLGLFEITGFGSYRYVWGNLTPKGEEMMKRAREVQYDF